MPGWEEHIIKAQSRLGCLTKETLTSPSQSPRTLSTALRSRDQKACFLVCVSCPILSLNHPCFDNPAGRVPSSNTAEIPTADYSLVGVSKDRTTTLVLRLPFVLLETDY